MAFWQEFKTKADLEQVVLGIVNPPALFEVFTSELLSNLVAERHYYYARMGMRPLEFRKDDLFRPYRFTGRFEGTDWQPVSWRKCLTMVKPRRVILQALRYQIGPSIQARTSKADRCERCGARGPVQAHHFKPPFRELAAIALNGAPEEELQAIIDQHNWVNGNKFTLPEDHPILQRFLEAHSRAVLRILCDRCHRISGYRQLPFTFGDLDFPQDNNMTTGNALTDDSLMPFGRYKGERMADVPVVYLHYLWNNGVKQDRGKPVHEYIKENRDSLEQENKDLIWDD